MTTATATATATATVKGKTRPWKRGQYKVTLNTNYLEEKVDGGTRDGYVRYPFAIANESWAITHLPSGLSLCNRSGKLGEAKRVVDAILALPVDWTLVNPLLPVEEEMRVRVRKVIMGIGGR